MKRKNRSLLVGALLMSLVFAGAACTGILEETPRANYTPGFLKTPKGIENGVNGMYAHLRYIYGGYFYAFTQCGTDESTFSQQADNNFKDADLTVGGGGNLTSSSDRADVLWTSAFPNINNANAIIDNSAELNAVETVIPAALVAEAHFFRGWDYFMLVQTFGGVPLDLGMGELVYNAEPSRTSVRNTVPEVYTKAVFPDLKKAIADLPDASRMTGTVTKNVARLFLAKAYLTYAWWLESTIPTYPAVANRTDPDGKSAAQYYQLAYDTAMEAITNPGQYGLMDTFFEAHLAANDRNKEIMLYADHWENDQYGGINMGYANGAAPENWAVWFATWQSELIRSPKGMDGNGGEKTNIEAVQRAATQEGGRPWTRLGPTQDVIKETFADKTNDSRYDGTFVATHFGNWEIGKADFTGIVSVTGANGMTVNRGGAIFKFWPEDIDGVTYPSDGGKSAVGGGELAGEAAFVIEPSAITRRVYPGLWKMGPQRTDNGGGLGSPNGSSPRPYNIAKFSELYLIAAEAAVQGATGDMSARDLVNVLRARAGKWVHKNAAGVYKGSGNYSADMSAAMEAATPATIDIEYILAERSRELYGEGTRWYDLARTGMWEEIAGEYHIGGTNFGGGKLTEEASKQTRTIEDRHYLRPIPQGQLDRMDPAARDGYQNPEW